MRTFLISDNHQSWKIDAKNANDAVAQCCKQNAGCALEVLARDTDGDWQTVLYALVDDDGEDHSSWAPHHRGPVDNIWCPVWQTQG